MKIRPGDIVHHRFHPEWGAGTVVAVGGDRFWAKWEHGEQHVWLPVWVLEEVEQP